MDKIIALAHDDMEQSVLSAKQRQTTAIVWLSFSILGVLVSMYLIGASIALQRSNPSETLGIAFFSIAGLFVAVLVLINWLGAYCIAFRFASRIEADQAHLRISFDCKEIFFDREAISFVWSTASMYVVGVKGGVALKLVLVGWQPFLCAKGAVVGI